MKIHVNYNYCYHFYIFVYFSIAIYYFHSLSDARSEMVKLLKDQLTLVSIKLKSIIQDRNTPFFHILFWYLLESIMA